jgi:hypothetical protein
MGWGILLIVIFGVVLGLIVLQATMASRHWDQVIKDGDEDALREALDTALDSWRSARPPKGTPSADTLAVQSVMLLAADRDRCRVSVMAGTDVRVVKNERIDFGDPLDVGRRAAVAMAERLLYEIPHVRFDAVQIDVYAIANDEGGATPCLLTTQVDRETAYVSEWDNAEPAVILDGWETREAGEDTLDPDAGALIETQQTDSARSAGEPG